MRLLQYRYDSIIDLFAPDPETNHIKLVYENDDVMSTASRSQASDLNPIVTQSHPSISHFTYNSYSDCCNDDDHVLPEVKSLLNALVQCVHMIQEDNVQVGIQSNLEKQLSPGRGGGATYDCNRRSGLRAATTRQGDMNGAVDSLEVHIVNIPENPKKWKYNVSESPTNDNSPRESSRHCREPLVIPCAHETQPAENIQLSPGAQRTLDEHIIQEVSMTYDATRTQDAQLTQDKPRSRDVQLIQDSQLNNKVIIHEAQLNHNVDVEQTRDASSTRDTHSPDELSPQFSVSRVHKDGTKLYIRRTNNSYQSFHKGDDSENNSDSDSVMLDSTLEHYQDIIPTEDAETLKEEIKSEKIEIGKT
jgi:hypothetical protein